MLTARSRPAPTPVGYRLVRAVTRLLLSLFYRRIEVVGRERLPASRGGGNRTRMFGDENK